MKEDLISVIIATFNSEKTINRALESIKAQTWKNIELVIVDGASKDNTLSQVHNFDFLKKVIISEPDNGIYDALNKGIKAAHGKWIYVLGSDDELIPDGLSLLMNEAVCSEYDCIYGDVLLRDKLGNLTLFKSKPASVLPNAMCCSHQALIMKKNVLLNLGGFDLNFKVSADYDLLIRAYLNGYKFRHVNGNVCYFMRDDGLSSKLNFYTIKEQYNIYKKNKTNKIPLIPVAFNFIKRLIRLYIYDPKKKQ